MTLRQNDTKLKNKKGSRRMTAVWNERERRHECWHCGGNHPTSDCARPVAPKNKILLTLAALALTACGQSYTAVSPAEALELASLHGPHYDLTVEVLDARLLAGCERAAEWWAPAAAILCVEGSTGLPGAVALNVGCSVPEGNWGWAHGYGEVCIIDTPRAIGCEAIVPHEIGHALGAPHTPRGSGLMASPSSCDAEINDSDFGLVSL